MMMTSQLRILVVLLLHLAWCHVATHATTVDNTYVTSARDVTASRDLSKSSDGGLTRQTVQIHRLPAKQRKHIKQEILSVLGISHPPKHAPSAADLGAAPSFMRALYESLQRAEFDEQGDAFSTTSGDNEKGQNDRTDGGKRRTAGERAGNGKEGVGAEKVSSGESGARGVGRAATASAAQLNFTLIGMQHELDSADMIMSFVNHGARHISPNTKSRELHFDVSEVSPTEAVTAAELRVYKLPTPDLPHADKLNIEVLRKSHHDHDRRQPMHLETSVALDVGVSGWINLNVTAAAIEWLDFPHKNLGLVLRVRGQDGVLLDPTSVGLVGEDGAVDKQTFLVAVFRTTPHAPRSRTKRSTDRNRRVYKNEVGGGTYHDVTDNTWGYRNDRLREKKCQRAALYVSFKDLEWQDWIIAPEGYSAYYCDGDCSFPLHAHMNATNHAIVQTLAHLMNAAVPKPCCAPTKLSAISVLYFDDNSNVILKKYRNMVVRACGCH